MKKIEPEYIRLKIRGEEFEFEKPAACDLLAYILVVTLALRALNNKEVDKVLAAFEVSVTDSNGKTI